MKIRLDENLSPRVAEAICCIVGNRKGFEVTHNRDAAHGEPDPLWLKKFAAEDGDVVISGDHNILQNWPDLIAYHQSGLIAFFPPPAFGKMKGYARAAFILRWWPSIVDKAKLSARGDCWRMPMQWTAGPTLFQLLEDPRLRSDERLIEAKQVGRPRKHKLSGGGSGH